MGGKEQALIKFSTMDYEAAAEEFGTQVDKFMKFVYYIIFWL